MLSNSPSASFGRGEAGEWSRLTTTPSAAQPIDTPECWNSREIVAMALYKAINFKVRPSESDLGKQEQQLFFCVEAKNRGDARTEEVISAIVGYLGMGRRQDDAKADLDHVKDISIAWGQDI